MALRLCVLASGSKGNCTYVGSDTTGILIDAGLSGRETIRRLGEIGVPVGAIQAVCVTHEHSDHTSGLAVLQKGGRVALYANSGTIDGLKARGVGGELPWQVFSTGSPFQVGDLALEPFSVPHDAYDPVGFIIGCGTDRVGVVTDMGTVTGLIRERLKRCQAIVVEANHDERLLKDADRPWRLKQRIFGRQGHLSNAHAAELIAEVAGESLAVAYLAHLSQDCNRPDLALKAVTEALIQRGLARVSVRIASPDHVSEVWVSG
jgi:phosphoribosyl 1,2-cyclic phosphodiesterase